MLEYTIRKLGLGLAVILTSTVILFVLLQILPGGDPITLMADPRVSEEVKQELRAKWGLDQPAPIRFISWASNIAKGDLGTSILKKEPVTDLIKQRLPYTLAITVPALFITFALSVPLGLFTAYKKNTFFDKGIVIGALILFSIPGFIMGIFLMKVFSINLRLFPISGYSNISSLVIPVSTMVVSGLASSIRILRSEVLEITNSRFVETAYAKGLKTRQVMFRHVLRNSLIPITIALFLDIPVLITGTIIIEGLFAIPGIGSLVFSAVSGHDYPVVQGIFLIVAIVTVISNTVGDIAAALLDPRIKLSMVGGKQ